jgi:FkbM family methyltransferase
LASYVREAIWSFFNERGREVPFIAPWHLGLRLCLNLGNELSYAVFVGGYFDPNELVVLNKVLQPGMHFLDVGAHEGLYTTLAARLVGNSGRVWAIEPSSRERLHLDHNIELNQLRNVTVLPFALAERDAQGELKIAIAARSGHNTLGTPIWDGVETPSMERVTVRSLDSWASELALTRLDVIKIDAEGSEMRIIQGALGVLRRFRPLILFEAQEESLVHQGATLRELIELIQSCRYLIHGFDPETGLLAAGFAGSNLNLVAVPQEQKALATPIQAG